MKPLHRLNPVRLSVLKRWVAEHGKGVRGSRVLDVGCGGGIVCEPLARMGASVTGIDAGAENIEVAREHAGQSGLDIAYACASAEDFAKKHKGAFDVVLALEIVEHVDDPELFMASLVQLARPGGMIVLSTLNRTPKSFALGIVAAEYLLRWVPKGTHDWKKFKKPSELAEMLQGAGANVADITGLVFDPLKSQFMENKRDVGVNYFLCATRQD